MDKIQNPSLSLPSLPEPLVLSCLARVPRTDDLNLCGVSKSLRSLVRLPELNRLRSLLHNNSLYVCFRQGNNDTPDSTFHWFTLRPTEETETTSVQYRLVLLPFSSHPFMSGSSVVAVRSKIYFVDRSSTDLWILETPSGEFTQGPSIKVCSEAAMGVIDGKIYLFRDDEDSQVEIFDPESRIWESAGTEKFELIPRFSASLEGKIYLMENEKTFSVYNPRECRGNRMLRLPTAGNNQREERQNVTIGSVCVVENLLFASFKWKGLMWFDTNHSVWRKLVGLQGKAVHALHVDAMAEYNGKLAVFSLRVDNGSDDRKNVWCKLLALHRVGEMICGTVEWSGIVRTIPHSCSFMHCLVVSD